MPWLLDAIPSFVVAIPWLLDALPSFVTAMAWLLDAFPSFVTAMAWLLAAVPSFVTAIPWLLDAVPSSPIAMPWLLDALPLRPSPIRSLLLAAPSLVTAIPWLPVAAPSLRAAVPPAPVPIPLPARPSPWDHCYDGPMRRSLLFALPWLLACAGQIPEVVELKPGADDVEIVAEAPSPNAYKFVGEVTGLATGKDLEPAQEAARNDLRNKAAALGGTLVTIDSNVGEPVLLLGKTKVKLVGRVYKPVD